MGGSETETKTEQQREPWGPAAGPLTSQVIPLASQWGRTPLDYTGPSYIAPTADMRAGTGAQRDWLTGAGQGIVNPMLGAWQGALDPSSFLNAPGASAPLDWYSQQVGRNIDENIRPGYAQGAVGAGQFGGLSSQMMKQDRLAQRQGQEAIANFGQQLTGNLWQQGLRNQMNALGMGGNVLNIGLAPGQGLYGLGSTERQEGYTEQQMANAAREFAQMEPFQRARMMAGLFGPLAQLGGTTTGTQTSTQQQDFGLQQALGLGMMGLGMFGGGGLGALGGLGSAGGGTAFLGNLSNTGMPSSWRNQFEMG